MIKSTAVDGEKRTKVIVFSFMQSFYGVQMVFQAFLPTQME